MQLIDLSKKISTQEIRNFLDIPNSVIMQLPPKNREEYYEALRTLASNNKVKSGMTFTQKAFGFLGPVLRNFGYEVSGVENIPEDGALFAFNHSNTHDAITLLQVLKDCGMPVSVMVTKEGVSPAIESLYKAANFTVIDRTDKDSCLDGMFELSSKMLQDKLSYGAIAPESTWNMDPVKPMRNWKYGVSKIAAITEKPIVPVIMEYVEVPEICSKESQLYSKCVVRFGHPFYIHPTNDLIKRTDNIQEVASAMRQEIWAENDIKRDTLRDVDPVLYCNHAGLKVGFGSKGPATFDYEREKNSLLILPGENKEWMYTIDENGEFVPGELTKEVFTRTLKK